MRDVVFTCVGEGQVEEAQCSTGWVRLMPGSVVSAEAVWDTAGRCCWTRGERR